MKFRQKQLNVLNEAFTDFLNKSGNDGSRFYDAQFQNEVYQNNMNKKFRKESGLNQPLLTRITNKVNLQNKEAVGEWYEGYGGKFSRQKNDLFVKMVDSIMKQAYSAAHLVEQVGARMTKYALSDNKEDFKKNLLKFVAKKLVVLP